MRRHLGQGRTPSVGSSWRVLLRPAHLRAYVLMVFLVLSTFVLAPYIATFLVINVGWAESDLKYVYLCGGLATLLTTPLFGRLADRFGKRPVFRVLAGLTVVPILLLTNLGPASMAHTLAITTLFMIITSGRMVPAMALITSSARPAYRGSFMSVNASVQQLAAGLAALLAGAILHQAGPKAPLEGYPLAGLLACTATLVSVCLAGYVRPAEELPAVVPTLEECAPATALALEPVPDEEGAEPDAAA
jgi:predicted MFS family arabinose efflux permease